MTTTGNNLEVDNLYVKIGMQGDILPITKIDVDTFTFLSPTKL